MNTPSSHRLVSSSTGPIDAASIPLWVIVNGSEDLGPAQILAEVELFDRTSLYVIGYALQNADTLLTKTVNPDQVTPCDAPTLSFASYQDRAVLWGDACLGNIIVADHSERTCRFFEEASELAQACGLSRKDAHSFVDYVYDRPTGERRQELGGVVLTLSLLASAFGDNIIESGETELARVWTKFDTIRTKQARKPHAWRTGEPRKSWVSRLVARLR